jgi:predicted nucleic acid-binding protein
VILADTSAWVEYDRASGSPVDRRLTHLIENSGPLAVTEPVLMEVLAGARDDRQEERLRRVLLRDEVIVQLLSRPFRKLHICARG